MPNCKYCQLKLNGMGSVFADSGAGVAIIACPRCHHHSYFLDDVAAFAFTKKANVWSTVSQALGHVAPAIATLGIWDITVAYNTFKKVLERTYKTQQQANNPIYNPMWISGIKKKAEEVSMPGSEESESGDEEFSYQTHEVSYDDAVNKSEAVISIGHLEEFLRGIIPHVVKFSLDNRDGEILKALGVLGTVIREARKAHRISSEQVSTDHSRTYLQ